MARRHDRTTKWRMLRLEQWFCEGQKGTIGCRFDHIVPEQWRR